MPVTFPDITQSFKETLHAILREYFDVETQATGSTHAINNQDQVFPPARIVFDVQHIKEPASLTIAFIGDGTNNRREYHHTHPNPPSPGLAKRLHGVEVRAEVVRTLVIACPNQEGTKFNRLLVDNAWSLLFALFETRRSEFSAVGIFSPTIPIVPADSTPRQDIVEAAGLFTCDVVATFARYEF